MNRWAGATALLGMVGFAAGVAPLAAQEFKGAEISAEALAFSDAEDLSARAYRGSIEFGVMGGFGVAADLTFYGFDLTDEARNVTLHLVYDAFSMATLGAFYATDSVDGEDLDLFGVEAGRSFGQAGGEAFLGFGDDEGDEFVVFGFDGAYDVTRAISVTASGAAVGFDEGGYSRFSVGGEYRFGDTGPAVYAEVGRLSADDGAGGSESDSFLGIGGRIAIGPNRGTTFESRGVLEPLGSF